MSVSDYIILLLNKSGLSMYALGKELGLKSKSHVWLLKNGKNLPSIPTCFKIINFAKRYDVHLTLDMLRGNEIDIRKNKEI
jgi:hypothetical protein